MERQISIPSLHLHNLSVGACSKIEQGVILVSAVSDSGFSVFSGADMREILRIKVDFPCERVFLYNQTSLCAIIPSSNQNSVLFYNLAESAVVGGLRFASKVMSVVLTKFLVFVQLCTEIQAFSVSELALLDRVFTQDESAFSVLQQENDAYLAVAAPGTAGAIHLRHYDLQKPRVMSQPIQSGIGRISALLLTERDGKCVIFAGSAAGEAAAYDAEGYMVQYFDGIGAEVQGLFVVNVYFCVFSAGNVVRAFKLSLNAKNTGSTPYMQQQLPSDCICYQHAEFLHFITVQGGFMRLRIKESEGEIFGEHDIELV